MPKSLIASLVVVILAGAAFVYTQFITPAPDAAPDAQTTETTTDTQVVQEPGQTSKKVPFASFISGGGTYQCSVKQNVQGITSAGTVYIDGKNIRADFRTSVQNMTVDSSMLVKDGDEYAYTWTSTSPNQGFKVKNAQPATANPADTNTQMNATYSWNAKQIGDYDCTPWTVDRSLFELPKGLNFKELSPQQ